jgi:hypothetical protein
MLASDKEPFRCITWRLLAAIEPWLGEVVIIGGRAHRLYRLHPSAQTLDYTPLISFDADIAIPSKLSKGDQQFNAYCLCIVGVNLGLVTDPRDGNVSRKGPRREEALAAVLPAQPLRHQRRDGSIEISGRGVRGEECRIVSPLSGLLCTAPRNSTKSDPGRTHGKHAHVCTT